MRSDQLRDIALKLLQAALQAADAAEAVREHIAREGRRVSIAGVELELGQSSRVWVVGAGKASGTMAAAVEEVLGDCVAGGLVVVKDGHRVPTRRVTLREASHPVPDERSVQAARDILHVVASASHDDLIVCVFSGGGSSLLCLPVLGLSLRDKQEATQALLACGAGIDEINCVRKHLSEVKGGRLAQRARARHLVSLLVSDVIGDRPDVIASGPTSPDPTTFADALAVLRQFTLLDSLAGTAVLTVLEEGVQGKRPETPKPGDPIFSRVTNAVVASNRLSLRAAEDLARTLGFHTLVLSSRVRGEAREVARVVASLAWEIWERGVPVEPPACVLLGGETTVTLGDAYGLGGRNQELALAAALELPPSEEIVLLCAGTDGTDGPTDAAGAVVDGGSAARARFLGLEPRDFLRRHDAYHFFQRSGELLRTGPTGTNVMDIVILLVGGRHEADQDRMHDRASQ
ncbi:MAG: glycerate kinase [candidate division KSB1 bacterium]|nr:glycerate kinase [candidate division KSB1 bacterium]